MPKGLSEVVVFRFGFGEGCWEQQSKRWMIRSMSLVYHCLLGEEMDEYDRVHPFVEIACS